MQNELDYFTESVNTLIDGKLILVDKNIASVLKCVATVPALTQCLSDTCRTMSYVTEFSRARVTWTRPNGTVEARLKMPRERNRLFAFVVCLLAEVDGGRRNFLEFLKEYYNDDANIGYEKFIAEALKPFKWAGESILQSVDPESLNADTISKAEKFFNVEKTYIGTETVKVLLGQIDEVARLFYTAGINAQEHFDDVMLSCEYFVNALYLKNPKILKICWLALKSLLELYPFADEVRATMTGIMSQITLK